MKKLFFVALTLISVTAFSQTTTLQKPRGNAEGVTIARDTVVRDTVPAKIYLQTGATTIKVINGYHEFQTRLFTGRDGQQYQERENEQYDGVLDSKKKPVWAAYPKAKILKIEDTQYSKKIPRVSNAKAVTRS